MSERRVLCQEPWSFTLYEDGAELVLEVVCGTVGIFDVVLRLSPDERAAFAQGGEPYVHALANAVLANPERFRGRS